MRSKVCLNEHGILDANGKELVVRKDRRRFADPFWSQQTQGCAHYSTMAQFFFVPSFFLYSTMATFVQHKQTHCRILTAQTPNFSQQEHAVLEVGEIFTVRGVGTYDFRAGYDGRAQKHHAYHAARCVASALYKVYLRSTNKLFAE